METRKEILECGIFEMEYATFGNGSIPFVILPGMSVKSPLLFADQVGSRFRMFSENFTDYIFDRRRELPEGCTTEDLADDTALAMKKLGISDACIYGASQGGMIAMEIAIRHPELAGGLFLASTLSRQNETCRDTLNIWIPLARKGDPVPLNREIFSRIYSPAFQKRYEKVLKHIEGQGTADEIRRFRIMAEAARSFDIYDSLDSIHCPVFVTGVEDDTVLGGCGSKEIAARLGCGIRVFPGKGHAVYDEEPGFPQMIYDYFINNINN